MRRKPFRRGTTFFAGGCDLSQPPPLHVSSIDRTSASLWSIVYELYSSNNEVVAVFCDVLRARGRVSLRRVQARLSRVFRNLFGIFDSAARMQESEPSL